MLQNVIDNRSLKKDIKEFNLTILLILVCWVGLNKIFSFLVARLALHFFLHNSFFFPYILPHSILNPFLTFFLFRLFPFLPSLFPFPLFLPGKFEHFSYLPGSAANHVIVLCFFEPCCLEVHLVTNLRVRSKTANILHVFGVSLN